MKVLNILLPTDFSVDARNAIDYAIYLFEKVECRFYILNAFEVGPSGLGSTMSKAKNTRLFRAMKEESHRAINRTMAELESKTNNPLHTFTGMSVAHSLLAAISNTAIDKNIHYIFMGTKGSSAVKEVFMGSNTIKVLRHIDYCPIIAVPGKYEFDLPDSIGFATNFEHIYSKAELNPMLEIARLWNSNITIIHVDKGEGLSPQQEISKNLLTKRLKGFNFSFEEVAGQFRVADAIMAYSASDKNIGMIAMIKYWHSFFEKLMKENVIKRVAFSTELPFLIFPLLKS